MTSQSITTPETIQTWKGPAKVVVYPGGGGWHAETDPYIPSYGAWSSDPETAIARLKRWAGIWRQA